jgi:hypothetical protein
MNTGECAITEKNRYGIKIGPPTLICGKSMGSSEWIIHAHGNRREAPRNSAAMATVFARR